MINETITNVHTFTDEEQIKLCTGCNHSTIHGDGAICNLGIKVNDGQHCDKREERTNVL